jgi:DNA gyrase/topoisomerase IV subunit B
LLDSAKTLAVTGLGVVGRDNFGVFPLRGKLLNVREASHKQIMDNQEINNIKQIMGLQHGKKYTNTATLRYGHLMIMTDQVCLWENNMYDDVFYIYILALTFCRTTTAVISKDLLSILLITFGPNF